MRNLATEAAEPRLIANLVRGAARHDQRCWEQLVERFSRLVWAIARNFDLRDADAADVSQTVWLRLAENLDRIEQPERVGTWLATTTRRECLRVKRLSARAVPTDDFESVDVDAGHQANGADLPTLLTARDALVWKAFSGLPEREKTLLLLLLQDPPLSYRDISDTLSMPIGSIGPTRARTLAGLRRRIEALGISGTDVRSP